VKIGLLHHIGGGNLGDDATQDAVMQNIARRWPNAELFAFSANPQDTRERHGIPSYPVARRTWSLGYRMPSSEDTLKGRTKGNLRRYPFLFSILRAINGMAFRLPKTVCGEIRFLVRSFRIIRSFDLLIVNGGGQLTEWRGPWQYTYTIFKWVWLARLARVRSLFLNVGAGPLTLPLSKYFVRHALSCAAYASFRDEQSRALVQQIGYNGCSHVFPDSVYGLDVPVWDQSGSLQPSGKQIVGVAPMPYCDPRVFSEKDQGVYDGYIQKLGQFVAWLVRHDYAVALFGSDIGVDPLAIEDLQKVLRSDGDIGSSPSIIVENVKSSEELLARMHRMDYVVTSRFHGVVFAHLLNKPVVALSHHPKVETLMSDIGLATYCVDIRTFDLELLTGMFATLVKSGTEVRARMAETLARHRGLLNGQFDDLFPQGTR
jgi:polysaccharide pyruvyl transferase WcaK-like protein